MTIKAGHYQPLISYSFGFILVNGEITVSWQPVSEDVGILNKNDYIKSFEILRITTVY